MRPIKQILITTAILLYSVTASAYDFEVDGIYYNITSSTDLTVEVTNGDNEYSGEVIIPETVVYKSKVLKVISISRYAFNGCKSLTSVVIGNNVTSIINETFSQCDNLTSVVIGNSVTSIGKNAFYYCKGLTNIEIPNSVTSIGEFAFSYCFSLTKIAIGNSVTSIGENAFYYCKGLTNIEIPNSVTSIENNAFSQCSSLKELCIEDGTKTLSLGYNEYETYTQGTEYYSLFDDCPLKTLYLGRTLSYSTYYPTPFRRKSTLTDVTIGNDVRIIEQEMFKDCSNISSITIPNNVTSIGNFAFSGCSGLKKVEFKCAKIDTWFNGLSIEEVIIDNSVTSIGTSAFNNCSNLSNIHLLSKNPPCADNNVFNESQYATLTIYIPRGSLSTYQSAEVWKNFWDIREEDMIETPEEVKMCATPLIAYNDCGLDITTETDAAEIHTNITCSDVDSYDGGRIDLSATYNITTYATKSGYLNSETATATFCWIPVNGESEETNIIKVEALPVLITSNNGTIKICGGKEGAEVIVYNINGVAIGNATITNGNATISTSLAKGEIVIVNIAGIGIKVAMQ